MKFIYGHFIRIRVGACGNLAAFAGGQAFALIRPETALFGILLIFVFFRWIII